MKVFMSVEFRKIWDKASKAVGARECMREIEEYFEQSYLGSSGCCELQFISASYDKYRGNASLMYWVVPTDIRAYNVLKLKWSDKDWEVALSEFNATQIDDSIEDDHFGVLVDMED